jgi:hypothetical protein
MTTRKDSSKPAADPAPLPGAGLGRVAYEAYSASVGGKSVRGEKLPTWDEQVADNHDVAAAWCAAAQAVITATFERKT